MATDRIADIFDMEPMPHLPVETAEDVFGEQELVTKVTPLTDEALDETTDDRLSRLAMEDFEHSRDNILNILKDSEDVMKVAKLVALSGQNAKDMSSYISSAKAHVENYKTLLSLHKEAQVNKPMDNLIPQQAEVINNNNIVFTGDTSDFVSMLKEAGITKSTKKIAAPE